MVNPHEPHMPLARRLLAAAASRNVASVPNHLDAAVGVQQALVNELAPLVGAVGVMALLARSLKLTRNHFPSLKSAAFDPAPPDDAAERLRARLGELSAAEAAQVAVHLYAVFLRLLTSFLGETLVRQLLNRAFPELQLAPTEDTD